MIKSCLRISLVLAATSMALAFASNEEFVPEEFREECQKTWESWTVEDNPMKETAPMAKSKVIRRSLQEYNSNNKIHKLGLYYGHTGSFLSREDLKSVTVNGLEISQGNDWYLVDQCWSECNPDAVLDITNRGHMAYFNSNWADVIYHDWQSQQTESIMEIARILKSGGQYILRPGGYNGWPQQLPNESVESDWAFVSENGLHGAIGLKEFQTKYGMSKEAREEIQQKIGENVKKFRISAVKNAREHFGNLGFSSVELGEIKGITKVYDSSINALTDGPLSLNCLILTKK